jgi:flagellar biosynthesis protein
MKQQEAVALKYDKEKNAAPKVTAKGKGATAQKIIEIAQLNEIPIKKDEDLLELLSKIELDQEIPHEMYKAVAEVFSFIYKITNKS